MSDGPLGLTESVSIALGGMIGGGIYAVLGVVAGVVGPATWAAFLVAGVVAVCAGYSYATLNDVDDQNRGGAVSFVQSFVGNTTLAGMTGWTLLFGYVGSMAMYAFAFGEFAVGLSVVPETLVGVPARPLISVLAVVGFVGLNLLGAKATGSTENVLVTGKILVLVLFGLGGLVLVVADSALRFSPGAGQLTSAGPLIAAAICFVAFQGWQLLFYDQDGIQDPVSTIRKAVYVSIPVAVGIYVLVGTVTVTIVPEALQSHPHTALATAAGQVLAPVGLREVGAVAISLSALLSTGSAINATMFSTGYFAKGMLTDDLLPDRVGDASASGVPTRTLLVIGVVTAGLTAVGSLGAITSFASLAFILVFGGVSALAFTQRDHDQVSAVPPAVGALGSFAFFPLMLFHLFSNEPGTFYTVVAIAAAVLFVELLYFERDVLATEVEAYEPDVVENLD
ncbi:APC family permease [Halobacteriales archaeon Cl-PHB]